LRSAGSFNEAGKTLAGFINQIMRRVKNF
jgi:hypothetical protein